MRILTFHLRGKMAHFRRYYTNSSALSYTIPPRTTITGIVAGLLGWERDSYYTHFSIDRCNIALSICAPIKKTMQKLNLLKVERVNELNASSEYHSQTATEFIIPQNIREGFVDYKIWLHHRDKAIMDAIEKIILNNAAGYISRGIALGLGTAFNLGWLENGKIVMGTEINESNNQCINSIIPSKKITGILTEKMDKEGYRLIKEQIPLEFDADRHITAQGLGYMIINLDSKPVPAGVKSHVATENNETITWME